MIAYPQHRLLWPIPETVPRQKAYLYLFLIGLTSIMIYLYSYPLSVENWSSIRQKISSGIGFSGEDSMNFLDISKTGNASYRIESVSASKIFQKLFNKTTAVKIIQLMTTNSFITKTSVPVEKSELLSSRVLSNTSDNLIPFHTKVPAAQLANLSAHSAKISSLEFSKDIVQTKLQDNKTKNLLVRNTEMSPNEFAKSGMQNNSLKSTPVDEVRKKNETQVDPTKSISRSYVDQRTTDSSETIFDNVIIKEKDGTTISNSIEEETRGITIHAKIHNVSQLKRKYTKPSDINQRNEFEKVSHRYNTSNTSPAFLTITGKKSQILQKSSNELNFYGNSTSLPTSPETTPTIQKGYLVFSEHCRIPDVDPMDPSIAHLIEKTAPLDCSEDYKPLTRTEGHVLFLNQTATTERAGGNDYNCCYRSVFRKNDGQSDNDVGLSKECTRIAHQASIKDEFIKVECKLRNGTDFYTEFHSFIFDKPAVEKRYRKISESQFSVLIIGVDSVSRLNMHRQLNATAKYLLKDMEAIEMYGFNKVGDNTFPNLIPMLTGYDERELPTACWKSNNLPLDKCNFLWNRFAEKGYRTLYAEDTPHISSFNYVKRGFHHQPTDYYFRHFMLAYEDALGRFKPLNCYQCVGSTSETEAVLHWTEQFAAHFSNRPYFSFSWINSMTHDFLNTGSSVDHVYERFFRTLHQSGALNKTIVILMGDHGMRWGSIRNTYVGRLEERLPMLLVALPQKFKQEYPQFTEVLKENAHRLTTPFDLHATLMHLLNLSEDWSLENTDNVEEELSENFTTRAQSLFQPVLDRRSCDDAFIEEHWCTCEASVEVDVRNNDIKQVSKFLLNHINGLLKSASDKCAFLTLDTVSDARLWQPPAEHNGHSADDNIYTVVIRTNPGTAIFEGTVKISKSQAKKELLGTISRLNLYGEQSVCIDDAILKKYCYCL